MDEEDHPQVSPGFGVAGVLQHFLASMLDGQPYFSIENVRQRRAGKRRAMPSPPAFHRTRGQYQHHNPPQAPAPTARRANRQGKKNHGLRPSPLRSTIERSTAPPGNCSLVPSGQFTKK